MPESLRMRVVEAGAEAIRGTIGDDLIDDAYCRVVAERALDAMLDCLAESWEEWRDASWEFPVMPTEKRLIEALRDHRSP